VGAEEIVNVDVRVISGTHKDLKKLVSEGTFREDLFYRLNVLPVRVPSLRERPADIPLLAKYFCRRVCAKNNIKEKPLEEEVLWELKQHHWPGNVRELQNVMERMVIMSGERISPLDLPEEIVGSASELSSGIGDGSALKEFRDNAEREFIIQTLKRNGGNISQSAIELGVRRTYLHRRLAVLGIAKKEWFS
jgi:DNA-binding NtrC family response regulator